MGDFIQYKWPRKQWTILSSDSEHRHTHPGEDRQVVTELRRYNVAPHEAGTDLFPTWCWVNG